MIEEGDLIWTIMISYFMQKDLIDKRDGLILRAYSNLTTIGAYVNHTDERLTYFAVSRRDMDVREERCTNSKLETSWMGGNIYALKVVVTKVEGERDKLKSLVEMITMERTALLGRRDYLSREGEENRANIEVLRFCLEEAETR